MKSILGVLDYIAGFALGVAGISVLLLDSLPLGATHNEAMVDSTIMSFGRITFSFFLVSLGSSILFRLHTGEVKQPAPTMVSRHTVRPMRDLGQKCPKPIVPTGPIHVLHVREENPQSVSVKDPRIRLAQKSVAPRPGPKRKSANQRSKSRASGSDDISLTGLLDLSTSVGDHTPMPASPEMISRPEPPAVVPDTIAAIWETVPNDYGSNIWLRPEPT